MTDEQLWEDIFEEARDAAHDAFVVIDGRDPVSTDDDWNDDEERAQAPVDAFLKVLRSRGVRLIHPDAAAPNPSG